MRVICLNLATLIVLFVSACTGVITEPGVRPIEGGGSRLECGDRKAATGESQRLTRVQLENAVEALLGFRPALTASFPDAQRGARYTTFPSANRVNRRDIETLADVADAVAIEAIDHFDTLLPCAPGALDEACVRAFLETVTPRAWRGLNAADETEALLTLYRTLRSGDDPLEPPLALAGTVSALLQSAGFLYLLEPGIPEDDGTRRLSEIEIANRIAFLFTDAPADAALLEAAEGGQLSDPGARRTHAERLLASAAAREPVVRFVGEWFGVGNRDLAPLVGDAVAAAFEEEWRRVVEAMVFDANADPRAFVTGERTFVNRTLAMHYGLEPIPADDDTWVEVTLPEPLRAGLLSRGAVAAAHASDGDSSIIRRGHFVREFLLCESLGNPPADAVARNPELSPGATVREFSEARISIPSCGSCHVRMDPIGIGMEDLDNTGRIRSLYASGQPVDHEGEILEFDGAGDRSFSGTRELGEVVAGAASYRACVTRQWFRFAMGREERGCQIDAIQAQLDPDAPNFREAILAVVESDTFVRRTDPVSP